MNETKSYKNFQLFLTDIFAKKYFKIKKKNNLTIFQNLAFLGILTYKLTSKFKFDLIRPT